ncbi:hypothetical protein OG909_25640 [Streptomyces sp. NBC_01754]|uniref:hypothetical protein n=1 Tax=Streptomyces sp. NBC_01754 TaxID=2975930 RepID=UPI002DDA9FD5|nr:hypothetical protein [Streptomyces sp. NBC_01754]WSC95394.1 hypothetical protein OG909_25640 [Streptomyces sp. NBC_01754]
MREQTEKWIRVARTPETRARIRREAVRERVFGVLVAVAVGLCALMVAASICLAVFQSKLAGRTTWFWATTIGTLLAFALLAMATRLWIAANNRRVDAMYADGRESVGTVVKVVEDDDRDPDTGPYYDITVTAAVAGTVSIRRVTRRAEAPRIGQRLRFRHNTLDPEDLDDVLFVGFVNEDGRGRG